MPHGVYGFLLLNPVAYLSNKLYLYIVEQRHIMQTNDHKVRDYDTVPDAKFGAEGATSRIEAEERAYAFYTGQIIEDAGKKSKSLRRNSHTV